MKISKKFVSLVLCVAMLISTTAFASMTSAPQTDAKNLALISEGFTSTGTQTMVKRGVAGASDQSSYKTIATFTPTLKAGSSDDYYMNLDVTRNGTVSTKNYAGFRKEETFAVKDRLFSVSYDIRFNSVPTSDIIITMYAKSTNASGTTGDGINRTIFDAVADNTKVGLWDVNSDYTIDVGTWYNVTHLFDTKTGYEYMTVTNPDNEVISITPQSCPAHLKNTVALKLISLTSPAPCNYDIDNIVVRDESVFLESTADSFLASEDVTLTATIPEGFENAVVMADGDVAGQISPVSGKNVYDVTIPASELGLGNHELILSSSYPDSFTRSFKTEITVLLPDVESALNGSTTGSVPFDVETFDTYLAARLDAGTYSSGEYKSFPADAYAFAKNTQWTVVNNLDVMVVPGPTKKNSDLAPQFKSKLNTAANPSYAGGLLQINGRKSGVAMATEGKLVIEFDIKLLTSDMLLLLDSSIPLWKGTTDNYLIRSGCLGGTSTVLPLDDWLSIKMVLDLDSSDWKWYVTIDDTLVIDGIAATKTTSSLDNFRLTFKGNVETIMAFDNARLYNVLPAPVINSAAYVTADGETETTGAIPADATAIKLNMSEALDVTADDVALYADGAAIAAEAVASSDGVVTITLPELEANTDLKVVLADTIDGVNSALSHNFYVTDSGSFFKTAGVVTSDNTATAVIRHMGSGTSNAIVAAYKGNQLVSINVCDFKSAADIGAVNVSASTAGADEIKIMAWNTLSSATPKMTATSYPIN